MPPSRAPGDAAGRVITVSLLVDVRGAVEQEMTDQPVSADSAYAASFDARLTHYHFLPAVLDGCAVPAWYVFRIRP